ncbi:hypothetical protein F2Q69_00018503 [Brassica cretica]|uniref:Uncharacterized protein n=1 Tax=Brassica cretica TaxID=69181 RepID=A0A8S9Q888_BRACR|nr:hypothetical protein F2Q69_00018503 [Brassica cretica]
MTSLLMSSTPIDSSQPYPDPLSVFVTPEPPPDPHRSIPPRRSFLFQPSTQLPIRVPDPPFALLPLALPPEHLQHSPAPLSRPAASS